MDFLMTAFDMFLHVDQHLGEFAMSYGVWIYGLLFLIIFLETGVVVTPFLPGDSLLFAVGALAAAGVVDIVGILLLLTAAAIIGDNTNYFIGRAVGPRVFTEHSKWLKREHLLRTQRFYEVHGGKTVIMARFVPIVRTFAPFVAGVGRMHYPRFLAFDVAGGILWVWGFGLLGYFTGAIPFVKENFGLVTIGVILISVVPLAFEVLRARMQRARAGA
jgi:membrane-associated protein